MTKPSRKNPGLDIIPRSPQGSLFATLLAELLGEDLSWQAVERMRGGAHLFVLRGERDSGMLVEGPEYADGECWVHRWGFIHEMDDPPVAVLVDYLAYRWDPKLAADKTGDRGLLEAPPRRRFRMQDQKDFEIGSERDRLNISSVPRPEMPFEIAGVPIAGIRQVMQRHGIAATAPDTGLGEQGKSDPWVWEAMNAWAKSQTSQTGRTERETQGWAKTLRIVAESLESQWKLGMLSTDDVADECRRLLNHPRGCPEEARWVLEGLLVKTMPLSPMD